MNVKYQIGLISITLSLAVCMIIATSYAYWTVNISQTDSNIVASGCFSATMSDSDPINLNNSYPISDAAGQALTPYSFTIENTCSIAADFNINLESLSTSNLAPDYVKLSFNAGSPVLLSSLTNGSTIITGSVGSKMLTSGVLGAGEQATYTLGLWIDEGATQAQAANKNFEAKIVVVTSATDKPSTIN